MSVQDPSEQQSGLRRLSEAVISALSEAGSGGAGSSASARDVFAAAGKKSALTFFSLSLCMCIYVIYY